MSGYWFRLIIETSIGLRLAGISCKRIKSDRIAVRNTRSHQIRGKVVTEKDLILRTKSFALRVVNVVNALPKSVPGLRIADQLFRCGTSVAANYRAACNGRSKAEFVAKLGIVEEEADESAFWLEMIVDTGLLESSKVEPLCAEAYELSRIMAASRMTARSRMLRSGT